MDKPCNPFQNKENEMKNMLAANSTFAIVGDLNSADSLVVAESFVLHFNISGRNSANRKSANRPQP
jgi:hypothetical protein